MDLLNHRELPFLQRLALRTVHGHELHPYPRRLLVATHASPPARARERPGFWPWSVTAAGARLPARTPERPAAGVGHRWPAAQGWVHGRSTRPRTSRQRPSMSWQAKQ